MNEEEKKGQRGTPSVLEKETYSQVVCGSVCHMKKQQGSKSTIIRICPPQAMPQMPHSRHHTLLVEVRTVNGFGNGKSKYFFFFSIDMTFHTIVSLFATPTQVLSVYDALC